MKLKPSILRVCQEAVVKKYGKRRGFTWCFMAARAPGLRDIHEALDYGVVKMNIDTDTQYAFTRSIVDHMLKNYDGVLKVDGEVGIRSTMIHGRIWMLQKRQWLSGSRKQ